MCSRPNLIRMDSASYTCSYGNDIFSFQVRQPESAVIYFPGDIQGLRRCDVDIVVVPS